MSLFNKFLVTTLGVLALFIVITIQAPQSTHAVSASDWSANNIIDDAVFYNKDALTTSEIQAFLSQKMPNCDTWGNKQYNGSQTRAQYSASKGVPTPFVCLKDYYENPSTRRNNLDGSSVPGGLSAAEIIKSASNTYNISPKVLIVLLQKEQTLITDDWPWPTQYRSATGYGCPDTAACDTQYFGFNNQVMNAARQFRIYYNSPNSYRYKPYQNNYVQYNPVESCGGTDVYIENMATAGLYNYTPYQPNPSALNNLYGEGNSCGAYGNRNFWRLFSDWFGSTRNRVPYAWTHESNSAHYDSGRTQPFTTNTTVAPGERFYFTVRARNMGNQTWQKGNFRLGTLRPTDRSSAFADSTWLAPQRPASLKEATVAPGQVGTFEFRLTAPQTTGTYNEHYGVLVEGREWLDDLGVKFTINVVAPRSAYVHARPVLTKGESLRKGQYLLSQDTQSVFTLLGDGNLMLLRNFRAVWDSQTSGRPANRLVLQNDGNLVLYDENNRVWWESGTSTGNELRLQSDGNLVLYNQSNAVVWSTATTHVANLSSFVNPSIGTARIYPGQQLETTNRRYKLFLQEDGNLVLYSPTRVLWASGTNGRSVANLSLLANGNLNLHDNDGRIYWQSNTAGAGDSKLVIQDDGNLVLYNASRPTWFTNTFGN